MCQENFFKELLCACTQIDDLKYVATDMNISNNFSSLEGWVPLCVLFDVIIVLKQYLSSS